MIGALGFGSEDQTRSQKAAGNGPMEANGTSPTGLISPSSSQAISQIRIVSRSFMAVKAKMDGMTMLRIIYTSLFAAGEFAQVWTKRQVNLL